MKSRTIYLLSASIVLSSVLGPTGPALAAEEGSLDSIWLDQPASGSTAPAKPVAVEEKVDEPAVKDEPAPVLPKQTPEIRIRSSMAPAPRDGGSSASGVSAPMVSLDDFKKSDLVVKGGWPGIGPFKSESEASTELVDDNQNRLNLSVSGDQIVKAVMDFTRPPVAPAKALLDMQMSVDFLLEAVGVKPTKIANFNTQLERSREILLRPEGVNLNFTVGRHLIAINGRKSGDTAVAYTVSVNSLDASKAFINQQATSEPVRTSEPVPKPEVKPTPEVTVDLKDQFLNVIRKWQKVKKVALKSRQVEDLSEILAGKALQTQIDALKFLADKHLYYDLEPGPVVIDRYAELLPGKKYAVFAKVKEHSRYIDETSGEIKREINEVRSVNYTIEKVSGHWFISDSAVLSAPSNKPPVRTR